MGRLVIASLAALAGCGRVAFDALDDARADDANVLVGHDEDGDGLADTNDPCPFLSGDNADADGDGVGDLCDPSASTAERIAVFEPMTGDITCIPDVIGGPGWIRTGDEWVVRGADRASLECMDIDVALTDADLWIGFEIEAVGPTAIQFSIAFIRSDRAEYFYSDLYSEGMPVVSVNQYDGFAYSTLEFQPIPSIRTGDVQIHYRARTTGGPVLTTQTSWPGETYSAQAPAPGYIGGEWVQFFVQHLDLRLRYFAIITP